MSKSGLLVTHRSDHHVLFHVLQGPLPTELGQLQQLRLLNLRGNRLSGGIPDEVCAMAELQHLVLADNQLQGRIPPGIFLLPKLWQVGILFFIRSFKCVQ